MKESGAIIVSWSFSHGNDNDVLLVGEKTVNREVNIINAFQGEEARELLERLTSRKEATE